MTRATMRRSGPRRAGACPWGAGATGARRGRHAILSVVRASAAASDKPYGRQMNEFRGGPMADVRSSTASRNEVSDDRNRAFST